MKILDEVRYDIFRRAFEAHAKNNWDNPAELVDRAMKETEAAMSRLRLLGIIGEEKAQDVPASVESGIKAAPESLSSFRVVLNEILDGISRNTERDNNAVGAAIVLVTKALLNLHNRIDSIEDDDRGELKATTECREMIDRLNGMITELNGNDVLVVLP